MEIEISNDLIEDLDEVWETLSDEVKDIFIDEFIRWRSDGW